MTGLVPLRWVFADDLAHVLADDVGSGLPAYVTVCGLGVPVTEPVYAVPPSFDMCRVCMPLPGNDGPAPGPLDVPPPTFPTPAMFLSPGRSPVEGGRRAPTAAPRFR